MFKMLSSSCVQGSDQRFMFDPKGGNDHTVHVHILKTAAVVISCSPQLKSVHSNSTAALNVLNEQELLSPSLKLE